MLMKFKTKNKFSYIAEGRIIKKNNYFDNNFPKRDISPVYKDNDEVHYRYSLMLYGLSNLTNSKIPYTGLIAL